jgi:hypothetical protein
VDLVANIAASVNICSNKSSETICLTETVAPNLIAQCNVPRFWLSFSFSFRKQRTRFFFLEDYEMVNLEAKVMLATDRSVVMKRTVHS